MPVPSSSSLRARRSSKECPRLPRSSWMLTSLAAQSSCVSRRGRPGSPRSVQCMCANIVPTRTPSKPLGIRTGQTRCTCSWKIPRISAARIRAGIMSTIPTATAMTEPPQVNPSSAMGARTNTDLRRDVDESQKQGREGITPQPDRAEAARIAAEAEVQLHGGQLIAFCRHLPTRIHRRDLESSRRRLQVIDRGHDHRTTTAIHRPQGAMDAVLPLRPRLLGQDESRAGLVDHDLESGHRLSSAPVRDPRSEIVNKGGRSNNVRIGGGHQAKAASPSAPRIIPT